ncbi:EamA family transporter, partial [Pantoea agglomerans]|nr:EamA family transporter [Pantoea agglomerans]
WIGGGLTLGGVILAQRLRTPLTRTKPVNLRRL